MITKGDLGLSHLNTSEGGGEEFLVSIVSSFGIIIPGIAFVSIGIVSSFFFQTFSDFPSPSL